MLMKAENFEGLCRDTIRSKLVPKAVSWYTGEEAEDSDEEYEDDDEEDGDDDDDDDDEEEVMNVH